MENVRKEVGDLGAASYLLMHGYRVIGRKGKNICFEIDAKESEEFEQKQLEYLSSTFHHFDSCLMSLKKTREYMPEEK